MSEAKFTRLKWSAVIDEHDEDGEWFDIIAESGRHYITEEIASVYSGEADANLIAAAPEMYEFIGHFMLSIPDIADDAAKLLAKARGEA